MKTKYPGDFFCDLIPGKKLGIVTISDTAADLDAEGYYNLVIDGLSIGTTYSFTVRAYDRESKLQDINNILPSPKKHNLLVVNELTLSLHNNIPYVIVR